MAEYEELRATILSRGVKSVDKTFNISAGSTEEILRIDGPAIIMKALAILTDKDAIINWTMDSLQFSYSPADVYLMGLDDPNPVTPFLTKYDTTNNIYAIEWVPAGGMLVNNVLRLSVTAVNDTSVHILAYYY